MEREAEILAFLSKLLEGADLASLSIKYIRAKLEEDLDAKAGRDYERAWLRSTVDELLARIAPAPDSTHADAPAASLQLEREPKEDKPLKAAATEEPPAAVPAEEAKTNHGEEAHPAEVEAAGEEGGARVEKKAPSLKQKYPDGTVIWAKMPSYPYWPSMVWRPKQKTKEIMQCIANGEVFVRFFGSKDYSFCRATEDWLVGLSRDYDKRRQKNKKLEKQFREAMAQAQKELDEPSTWTWETEVIEAEDESEEEEVVEGEEEQDAESDAAEQKPAYVDSSDEEAATSAERNVVKPAPRKPKAKPKAADATTPRKPKVAVVARSDEDEDEDEDEEAAAELGEPDDKAKDADFAEREQEGSDDEEKAGRPIAGGSKRRKRGGKAGGEAGEKKKTGKAALKAERAAAGEPKKNMNAYMFFSNEFRISSGSGNAAESSKLASQKWKELTDEEREPYLAKAAADKERYQVELKAFRESHGETQAERIRKEAGKKPSKPRKPRVEGGGGGGGSGGGSGGGESMKQVLDKLAAAREQRLEVQVLISKSKKKLEKVEGWRVKMKEEGEPEEKLQQLDVIEKKVMEEHEAQLAKLAEIKGEMRKLVARVDELEEQQKERKRKKNEEKLQEPVDATGEEDVRKAKRERHAESKPSHHEERKSERQREQREEEEEIRQQTRQVGRGAEDRRGDAPARPSRPRSEPTQEESAEGEKAGRAEGEKKKKKRKLAVESDDEGPETDKPNGPTSEHGEGSDDGEHAKVDVTAARLAELLEWKRVLEGALATEGSVDDEAAAKALVGLERIEMTLALLEQSGIGKLITKLRKSSSHLAGRAKRLYEQWKALVSSSS